jgi:phosphatidylethanolamine/phosphatidyl-N-methylethanolamine N-methyltransferase
MLFLKEILCAPSMTGAIAPTSRHLAQLMVEKAGVRTASMILELGPGTGAVTEQILKYKRPDARMLAIERNPNFVSSLNRRFPGLCVVNGCASELRAHLTREGRFEAESVVSALPWTIFAPRMQERILLEIRGALSAEGIFATFACFGLHVLPVGHRFRQLLERTFSEVRTSELVLANMPPAFVYYCSK